MGRIRITPRSTSTKKYERPKENPAIHKPRTIFSNRDVSNESEVRQKRARAAGAKSNAVLIGPKLWPNDHLYPNMAMMVRAARKKALMERIFILQTRDEIQSYPSNLT